MQGDGPHDLNEIADKLIAAVSTPGEGEGFFAALAEFEYWQDGLAVDDYQRLAIVLASRAAGLAE